MADTSASAANDLSHTGRAVAQIFRPHAIGALKLVDYRAAISGSTKGAKKHGRARAHTILPGICPGATRDGNGSMGAVSTSTTDRCGGLHGELPRQKGWQPGAGYQKARQHLKYQTMERGWRLSKGHRHHGKPASDGLIPARSYYRHTKTRAPFTSEARVLNSNGKNILRRRHPALRPIHGQMSSTSPHWPHSLLCPFSGRAFGPVTHPHTCGW